MSKKKTVKKIGVKKTVRKKASGKAAYKAQPIDSEVKKRASSIYRKLVKLYPDSKCALIHDGPFELLVATILSAQCTDKRVNMVTPGLFEKYAGPKAFADAKIEELEEAVRSTGFYRNKAKNIKASSRMIVEQFGGQVPDEMEDLLMLAGVARKTANVVLGNAFGKNEGVVVDTHVGRLSKRMGLTEQKDPVKVERDLMGLFVKKNWTMVSHLLIDHGRAVCSARKADCEGCGLKGVCEKVGV